MNHSAAPPLLRAASSPAEHHPTPLFLGETTPANEMASPCMQCHVPAGPMRYMNYARNQKVGRSPEQEPREDPPKGA